MTTVLIWLVAGWLLANAIWSCALKRERRLLRQAKRCDNDEAIRVAADRALVAAFADPELKIVRDV